MSNWQAEEELTSKYYIPQLYYYQAESVLILNQNNRLGFLINMFILLEFSALLLIRTQNNIAVLSSQTEGSDWQ